MKKRTAIVVDFFMTILLLLLMAFQVTGQEFHEWLGVGMLVLFLVHNILNYKWYKNLFKGKYNIIRILRTIINIAVFVSMLCLAYSGIVMSRYVFEFISAGGMALARRMHMAVSYWGFVLMSIHLGFHWRMVVGMAGKMTGGRKLPKSILWIFRIPAVLIAVYGAVCFYRLNIISYMFLKVQFVFWDFEKTVFSVLLENIAMMGLWVLAGYYFIKGMSRLLAAIGKGDKLWKGESHEKN